MSRRRTYNFAGYRASDIREAIEQTVLNARNREIAARFYVDGECAYTIAEDYGVTAKTVFEIARKAGSAIERFLAG